MFGELYDVQRRGKDPAGFAAFFTVFLSMVWIAPVYLALVALPQLFWNECFVLSKWLTAPPILATFLLAWLYLRNRALKILSGPRLDLDTFSKQRSFVAVCIGAAIVMLWVSGQVASYSCVATI